MRRGWVEGSWKGGGAGQRVVGREDGQTGRVEGEGTEGRGMPSKQGGIASARSLLRHLYSLSLTHVALPCRVKHHRQRCSVLAAVLQCFTF